MPPPWPNWRPRLLILLASLAPGVGALRVEAYEIQRPVPLQAAPSSVPTATPAPASAPTVAGLRTPQPLYVPAPAPSPVSPLPPGVTGPPQRPSTYTGPVQRPGTYVGPPPTFIPAPTQTTGQTQRLTAPAVPGAPSGMVIYNLMFPGGGQEYQVRVENNGGVNSMEITPGRGAPYQGSTPYGSAPYQGQQGYPAPGQQGGPGGPYPQPMPTPGRATGYPNAPVLFPNGPIPFDQVPDPSQLVEPPRRPGPSRYAAIFAGPTFIGESDPSGGLDFAPALVTRLGLTSWYDLDDTWYASGRFAYDAYTITDKQAPDSRHHRDEFDLKLGGGYTLPFEFARVAVGLGYAYQQVSVASNRPPSLSSPRLSAPSRGYHGPTMSATAGYVVAPALRADLDLEAKPGIFVVGDDTVTPLAPMFGYGASIGISWRPAKPVVVRAAYRYDYMTGYRNDFSHTAHGPELSVDWRF
ncbi:MAG: hypothetical protein JWM80_1171 [Cyanobacteria bacterium RYN_339]|nr:hypothetical protein [Cyanobacteria bacterium RYN_339]